MPSRTRGEGEEEEGQGHDKQERGNEEARKPLVFELHGSQFENRAPDRANKKFKWKGMDYL
jgi:ribonuclease P protein subunit POP4